MFLLRKWVHAWYSPFMSGGGGSSGSSAAGFTGVCDLFRASFSTASPLVTAMRHLLLFRYLHITNRPLPQLPESFTSFFHELPQPRFPLRLRLGLHQLCRRL